MEGKVVSDFSLLKEQCEGPIKVVGIITTGTYNYFSLTDQVALIKLFSEDVPCLELQRLFKTRERGEEANKKFREAVAFTKENGTRLIIMTFFAFSGVNMPLLVSTIEELIELPESIRFYF